MVRVKQVIDGDIVLNGAQQEALPIKLQSADHMPKGLIGVNVQLDKNCLFSKEFYHSCAELTSRFVLAALFSSRQIATPEGITETNRKSENNSRE